MPTVLQPTCTLHWADCVGFKDRSKSPIHNLLDIKVGGSILTMWHFSKECFISNIPIPSTVLQSISNELLPHLPYIINGLSPVVMFPNFPLTLRWLVTPHLKNTTLDPSDVRNNQPVSLLPLLLDAHQSSIRALNRDCSPGCDECTHHCKSLILLLCSDPP